MDQPQAAGSAVSAHNPYPTPHAAIAPPPPLPGMAIAPASRGARLGARLLDQLLGAVALSPMFVVLIIGKSASGAVFAPVLLLSLALLAALFVANLVSLARRGQTLGKRLVGIRIVRRDGSHPSLGRSFGLRSFVPGLIGAFVAPFGLLDVLWIFGEERRCLHDLMADTIVVPAQ